MQVKGGDVVRPGHIERLTCAVENPVKAGLRQCSGDTTASPCRFHENAAEIVASRSSRGCLVRCQLDYPAVRDYLTVGLGHEHLARVIGDVGCELLATVSGVHPKDTFDKLDRRADILPA